MQIKSIEVKNFRALRDVSMDFDQLTTIIGENNSGKSSFLKAIDLFFAGAPRITERDFHSRNHGEPIEITLEFSELTPAERQLFEANMIDGKLIITRTLSISDPDIHGRFSVDIAANPDFSDCRSEAGKNNKRAIYRELQDAYPELPNVQAADEIERHLSEWEHVHINELVRIRGPFRGFTNVAVGQLRTKTEFISVPAVKDAVSDVGEGQRSPIRDILNAIARQTIENSQRFREFVVAANAELAALTSPDQFPALADIGVDLSNILQKYYRNSELITTWDPITEFPVSFPSPRIDVRDHNFVTGIDGVGHGLQRAVILTVLEYVASRRNQDRADEAAFGEAQSDIILGIEEPEIYQHPTKQRLFRQVLQRLAQEFSTGTGIRIQVIFVTHSPLFIDLVRCQEIRMVRRIAEEDGHQQNVAIRKVTISECSAEIAEVLGKTPMGDAAFSAKLHTFTPEISEGFFARAVVLVEGVSDKAIIEGWYRFKGRSPLEEGIVVASVDGKTKLDKPVLIFSKLGVPTYLVFDNDRSDNKKKEKAGNYNRLLQRLCGLPEDGCAEWPDGIFDSFAAWDGNVERYVRNVVGDNVYGAAMERASSEFEVVGEDCVKSPAIASYILADLCRQGFAFERLDNVLASIDKILPDF